MLGKVFEELGRPVATVGALGFKIGGKEWPNTLKITMLGRMKLQKFLYRAKKAGVKYVILEATSEGIVQNRLAGVKVDCAIFTGLHPEHIESHGSFKNYTKAKQKLFIKTKNTHIINIDDKYFEKFINIPSGRRVTFGIESGDVNNNDLNFNLRLVGKFNIYNALAVMAVSKNYGLDDQRTKNILEDIQTIPGRMEFVKEGQPYNVVIDYAVTPESLEAVYKILKPMGARLICVLGSAGGGRDKWKRPKFGEIAQKYCDEIILTNEDPYDENPDTIIEQIVSGLSQVQSSKSKVYKVSDRKEAIGKALALAQDRDVVVITGKGSEISMAVSGGRKIPWSDKKVVVDFLRSKE